MAVVGETVRQAAMHWNSPDLPPPAGQVAKECRTLVQDDNRASVPEALHYVRFETNPPGTTGVDMDRQSCAKKTVWVLGLILFFIGGCEITPSKQGLDIMFDGRANITQPEVYFSNKVVGEIMSRQLGNGSVEMITITLAPEFENQIGRHWVFYIRNGRLIAARIGSDRKTLPADAKLCGFHSKSALNWFKFKTLLDDRVYRASLRAEQLYRRFL